MDERLHHFKTTFSCQRVVGIPGLLPRVNAGIITVSALPNLGCAGN